LFAFRQNPGLSPGDMAGRLAELWQSAPHQEKQAWSLKAKKLALKTASTQRVCGFYILDCVLYIEIFNWGDRGKGYHKALDE
jgi:hypothetical protein